MVISAELEGVADITVLMGSVIPCSKVGENR